MKERPILFSAPMVRAILDNMKTQTRRIIKPPFPPDVTEVSQQPAIDPHLGCMVGGNSGTWEDGHGLDEARKCPYGIPGDRLWVRETFALCTKAGGHVVYAAEGDGFGNCHTSGKWTPSLFMKREYSRITLEIVSVRVERLQDITEADAKAEGVSPQIDAIAAAQIAKGTPDPDRQLREEWTPATMEYWALWKQINGPDSWKVNPWVWVIEFAPLFIDPQFVEEGGTR